MEAVSHSNFDYIDQQAREIFSKCLDANCKVHENMRVLKIREFWDKSDDNLVLGNKLTKHGISMYWKSLDASLQFNIKKRDEFLIRNRYHAMRAKEDKTMVLSKTNREDMQQLLQADGDIIPHFFAQHQSSDGSRFRWCRDQHGSEDQPRFLLPRLKDKFTNF